MMKILALLAVIVVVSARFEHQDEFDAWKLKFSKGYESDTVELKRQIIWESNKNFVENHNKNGDKFGFTVEMNEFADLDSAEFKGIYNGLLPRDASYFNPNQHVRSNRTLAEKVDWRTKGVVTEVKNQGQCGSCWSFSATGSLEGQHAIKTGKLVSLSEQQLMDCSTSFGNHGCNGGLMDNAFKYIASVKGDDTEECYPYKAENGFCKYNANCAGAGDSSYKDIRSGDESALMDAVASVGPIAVAIDAGHKSFQLYTSGVYTESECSTTTLDHGVLAVGYGTKDQDYWLVKNSWGPSWGMEGYIMMRRNYNNMCGIATQASYPTGVN